MIHSFRRSRLKRRRDLYFFLSACMTACLAIRKQFLERLEKVVERDSHMSFLFHTVYGPLRILTFVTMREARPVRLASAWPRAAKVRGFDAIDPWTPERMAGPWETRTTSWWTPKPFGALRRRLPAFFIAAAATRAPAAARDQPLEEPLEEARLGRLGSGTASTPWRAAARSPGDASAASGDQRAAVKATSDIMLAAAAVAPIVVAARTAHERGKRLPS
mmetsp:Transcript_59685/g.107370  ORF Transcript_59685/g.107370 Transcript_59685/m.107370 type:complete len:219 (+) Transcript_59685:653-1309(+)